LKNNPAKFHPDPISNNGALSPVHTGNYSRHVASVDGALGF